MKIIKYNLTQHTNVGTPDEPIWEESKGYAVEIRCTDANFDANYALAKKEAWNSEVTVEDDGQPEPDNSTTDDVLNTLLGVRS